MNFVTKTVLLCDKSGYNEQKRVGTGFCKVKAVYPSLKRFSSVSICLKSSSKVGLSPKIMEEHMLL